MDGTKRTAFAATLYFLERLGYSRFSLLPEDEVIRFCLEIAEENIHRADNPALPPKTIAEIAAWFRRLLGVKD